MKIEKVNDNQIRCTLTREDLANRQIKLSELAYGSEKAKLLFQDMMQQAAAEYGFEAEDIPLMIEAVPLSSESVMLIITKVESPEELDTRFSNFSNATEDIHPEDAFTENENPLLHDPGKDILDMIDRIQKEKEKQNRASQSGDTSANAQKEEPEREAVKMFSFSSLDTAFQLADLLKGFYTGDNAIYKDTRDHSYHLVAHQGAHSLSEFYKVYNTIAEYTQPENYTPGAEAFFREHSQTLLAEKALQTLAETM